MVEEQAQGLSVREEDKEFIARLIQYVLVGTMLDWIKDDMKADPQLLVERLAQAMKGSIRSGLKNLTS